MNIVIRTASKVLVRVPIGERLRDFTPIAEADSVLVKNLLNGKFIVRENVYFDIYDDFCMGWKIATICVPAGFETDFGSIPKIFRGIIEGIGTARDLIYLLHDWLYATEFFSWVGVAYVLRPAARDNRAACDNLLLEGCKHVGDNWATRNTIWSQVRLWGWVTWNTHTLQSVTTNRALLTQGGQA